MTLTPDGPAPRRGGGEDSDPFERLFLAEYGRVVGVAHRILVDRSEAEDVAQEVFIDFHRRHPADAAYARSWLHSAAAHTALNRLRGRRRQELRERNQAAAAVEVLDPAQEVVVAEERRLVRRGLARLADRQAAVLALRYSGLSYAEVGAALGVGAGQVGTLLRRAEAALKKEINRGPSV